MITTRTELPTYESWHAGIGQRMHSTPEPDIPGGEPPTPPPPPVPDDVPDPVNAPVEEPRLPEPPIRAS
ncbi:hypothetical protein [Telluria beijingensis]|uniref:hypothetical protein n=1 Tax=Telluria beijingensis TaxID=3068633 RepID=UPI002795C4C0|nr:hypothetical protein [Massilia sp. REN29]